MKQAYNLMQLSNLLQSNSYPGRGIVMGRDAAGENAVAAYFIMGRSENSRNRVFAATDDGIRTVAHDPSKMTDPSLIIYHPVRQVGRGLIVTNGDQTDTIRDYLLDGRTFAEALQTRTFEPDAPNYTPRISALLNPDGSFQMSILKSDYGVPDCCCHYTFRYDLLPTGEGRFLHTYQGDGDPLPSFQGEPRRVRITAPDAETMAYEMWNALNLENRVSLYVRYTSLTDGSVHEVIKNRYDT